MSITTHIPIGMTLKSARLAGLESLVAFSISLRVVGERPAVHPGAQIMVAAVAEAIGVVRGCAVRDAFCGASVVVAEGVCLYV